VDNYKEKSNFPMTENAMKTLRENWMILVFIVSMIITWTQFQNRIATLELSVAKLDSRVEANVGTLTGLKTDIAEIKVSLEYIKTALSK